MRQTPPPSSALGRQLAEWRRPLDDDPEVDEAVSRLVRSLDRLLRREARDREQDIGFSPAAAD